MHFPGFSAKAVEYLISKRISGIGADAMSVDAGDSKDYAVHTLALGSDLYQMENLSDLSEVPESGAVLIVAPIKLEGGSGGACRVFAIIPETEPNRGRLREIMLAVSTNRSAFTPLERAVLRAICTTLQDRTALETQLSTAAVTSRENTGAGFYAQIAVQRDSVASVGGERLRNGPAATIEGLEHGMGFILWLKRGFADCLEGYCYNETTTGIEFDRVSFELAQS